MLSTRSVFQSALAHWIFSAEIKIYDNSVRYNYTLYIFLSVCRTVFNIKLRLPKFNVIQRPH